MSISSAESAILTRLVLPATAGMSTAFAEGVLAIGFNDEDRERVAELSRKAGEGTLTRDEQEELDSYERVGHFLSLLKSKARRSLQVPPEAS